MTTRMVLSAALLTSAVLNLYLYSRVEFWQEAWLDQFVATSEIETVLIAADGDYSFGNIITLARKFNGADNVKVVDISGEFEELGVDDKALGVNYTLYFFEDSQYYGSLANARDH